MKTRNRKAILSVPISIALASPFMLCSVGGAVGAEKDPMVFADSSTWNVEEWNAELNKRQSFFAFQNSLISEEDKDEITTEELEQLQQEILAVMEEQAEQGEVTYTTTTEGKNLYSTDVVFDGNILQFYYEADPDSSEAEILVDATYTPISLLAGGNEWYPKIWAGKDSKGIWIRFNRAAQSLLISSAGTALKTAICAIPAVGSASCAVIWTATLIAKKLLKSKGRCSTSKPWFYVYPTNANVSGCRA